MKGYGLDNFKAHTRVWGRGGCRDQSSSKEELVEVEDQVSKTTLPGPLDIDDCSPLAVWVQPHCKGEPQVRICEWLWSAANKKPITAVHKKIWFPLHHYHLLFALYGVPFHCLLPYRKTGLIHILCLPPPSDPLSLPCCLIIPPLFTFPSAAAALSFLPTGNDTGVLSSNQAHCWLSFRITRRKISNRISHGLVAIIYKW